MKSAIGMTILGRHHIGEFFRAHHAPITDFFGEFVEDLRHIRT